MSILIRSMDREYLAEALASIALQTYPRIEVVVQSVRPCHKELGSHCGPFPIRLIPTDEPVMRSAAANRAMVAAKGDYLLFLDDDDWLMPDHIARLADTLSNQPLALAVYTGIALVDAQGQPLGQAFDVPFDGIRQLAGNLTPIHSVLFKANVMLKGCRFDTELDRLEDWDFWLQLSRLAPMVHLPGVSAVYRIHESSGVHHDSGPLGAASARIYRKWEVDWTPAQIGQIMQRVWTYPELESQLTQANTLVKQLERQLASSQEAQAQQLARMNDQAAALERQADTLVRHQSWSEELLREIHTSHSHFLALDAEHRATLLSTSWQLTRPLRWIGHVASRLWRVSQPVSHPNGALSPNTESGPKRQAMVVDTTPAASPATESSPLQHPATSYADWVRAHDTPSEQTLTAYADRCRRWTHQPLVSILMPVYNPPLDLLEAAIASIQSQVYPHWELCMADDASPDPRVWETLQRLANADARIKVARRSLNGHISHASNSALELASGTFVALMDNDDLLPPDALYWVVETINRHPDAGVLYSDEDKLDSQGERFGPYFKPEWNYTLFLGHNLISHLGVYRTQLVRDVGAFRVGMEGSQDYDLALRCVERLSPQQIVHIPRVLYHWRAIETSTALNIESKPYALYAARLALEEHLVRVGDRARVEIQPSLNYRCLRSEASAGQTVTVVLIGPTHGDLADPAGYWAQSETIHFLDIVRCEATATAINRAVAAAKGHIVALIRSDLVPNGPEALSELIGHAVDRSTGVAAGSVRDASGRLLSGGLILNPARIATVLHKGLPTGNQGYVSRGFLTQELSAVSLDCVAMRKDVFQAHGGLDDELGVSLPGAVAWCLRLRNAGLRIIWCPEARWTATTHNDAHDAHDANITAQTTSFLQRYGAAQAAWLLNDPAYHPALDAEAGDFSLKP